jgi:hypothetical protein
MTRKLDLRQNISTVGLDPGADVTTTTLKKTYNMYN